MLVWFVLTGLSVAFVGIDIRGTPAHPVIKLALAMRAMASGDCMRSLRQTFLPELLSMNLLMAGMVVTMHSLMPHIWGSADPLEGWP